MVMDAAAADKTRMMNEEKVGPPRPCSGQSCSRYSMSRTCGPRDMISQLSIKSGDNRPYSLTSNLQQYM
jgi:hypothetical protein